MRADGSIHDELTASLALRRPELAPVTPMVTAEQLALVKTTVAQGASDAELKLFLFDCQRQGVHPLDKLLHFTKRGGKYTPITSIDFMRTRAADTGEYAGSDDAVFTLGPDNDRRPHTATVTVYRIVQGLRCAFTATARWDEYCPAAGQDHMWKKMPHTMLAKCAEALALRKGFPRQLAGLYAKEEMDQAGPINAGGYIVEAPAVSAAVLTTPVVPAGGGPGRSLSSSSSLSASDSPSEGVAPSPMVGAVLPSDAITIRRLETTDTKNQNIKKTLVYFSTGEQASTINKQLAALAEQLCQDGEPVVFTTNKTKWGEDLVMLKRASSAPAEPTITADDIPF